MKNLETLIAEARKYFPKRERLDRQIRAGRGKDFDPAQAKQWAEAQASGEAAAGLRLKMEAAGMLWPEDWRDIVSQGRSLEREVYRQIEEWSGVTVSTSKEIAERNRVLQRLEVLTECFQNLAAGRPYDAGAKDRLPWKNVPVDGAGEAPPESPEEYVQRRHEELRERAYRDRCMVIARELKDSYPLSENKIGGLLPATPGSTVSYEGRKSRGQRLLGKK